MTREGGGGGRESPEARLEEGAGEALLVRGPMGFDTVVALRRRADPVVEDRLERGGSVVVDLSGVTRTDSAGLALLVHWSRRARVRGARLELRNVPGQMLSIARTVGLEGRLLGGAQGESPAAITEGWK